MIFKHLGFFLCLTIVIGTASAYSVKNHEDGLPDFFMGRSSKGFVPPPPKKYLENDDEMEFIEQSLDHFNKSDKRTFKQRFLRNFQYHEKDGPIFLFISGESPFLMDFIHNEQSSILSYAKEFKAALFEVEHRFYGESFPVGNLSLKNLEYLSSRQALEDLAKFILYMNKNCSFSNPKWIVFGGFYAGNLALWFREKYPELTVGAVASSAPVQSVLDFYDYDQMVSQVYWNFKLEESRCGESIKEVFDEVSRLIWTPSGRTQLSDTLELKSRLDNRELRYVDVQFFFFRITSLFEYYSQHYDPDNFVDICATMMNKNINKLVRLSVVIGPVNNDYEFLVNSLKDESITYAASTRAWIWQTCTEFGYYQSSDKDTNIFGDGKPVSMYIQLCRDIFGDSFTAESIEESIRQTNLYYGGWRNYTGTNVVVIDGSYDPWSALGFSSEMAPNILTDSSVLPYKVHGTGHCADMIINENDSVELKYTREIAKYNMRRWIDGIPIIEVKKNNGSHTEQTSFKTFDSSTEEKILDSIERHLESEPMQRATKGLPKFIMGRPVHGMLPEPDMPARLLSSLSNDSIFAGFITQPINQFDPFNIYTFKQRYWYNKQFHKTGGPHFLVIGGEAAASLKWVANLELPVMQLAKKFNATVYLIEHRYYGESRPEHDQISDIPVFLDYEQALADIARFILTMNKQNDIVDPKWILFGGSYSGVLAAWFREKYPNLSIGAVASSAPIEIKLDFYNYLIVTHNSIRKYDTDCIKLISDGFEKMHQLSLSPKGRVELSDIFTLDPKWTVNSPVTDLDVQYFFSNIYGNFQGAVQYNNDNRGKNSIGGGIKEICEIMKNNSFDPIINIARVNQYMSEFFEGSFERTSNSYSEMVDELKNPISSDMASAREWTYQTCTQFGYFQTTDSEWSTFGLSTPLNFFLHLCVDVFRFYNVERNVDDINELQGGKHNYKGTNVLFIDGDVDPWHALGNPQPLEKNDVASILIPGTAHCANMYPPRKEDPKGLNVARELEEKTIKRWLDKKKNFAIRTTISSIILLINAFYYLSI